MIWDFCGPKATMCGLNITYKTTCLQLGRTTTSCLPLLDCNCFLPYLLLALTLKYPGISISIPKYCDLQLNIIVNLVIMWIFLDVFLFIVNLTIEIKESFTWLNYLILFEYNQMTNFTSTTESKANKIVYYFY